MPLGYTVRPVLSLYLENWCPLLQKTSASSIYLEASPGPQVSGFLCYSSDSSGYNKMHVCLSPIRMMVNPSWVLF